MVSYGEQYTLFSKLNPEKQELRGKPRGIYRLKR